MLVAADAEGSVRDVLHPLGQQLMLLIRDLPLVARSRQVVVDDEHGLDQLAASLVQAAAPLERKLHQHRLAFLDDVECDQKGAWADGRGTTRVLGRGSHHVGRFPAAVAILFVITLLPIQSRHLLDFLT